VTKRVLIVDDEPPVLEVLRDFFRQFRHADTYETVSAKDGAESRASERSASAKASAFSRSFKR